MGKSDKSLTLYSHDIYIRKYIDLINYHIETSQPLAFIGAYGLGKGIITDYLLKLNGEKYKVAYVDMNIFIKQSEGKLFAGILNSLKKKQQKKFSIEELSEDEFYWRLTNELEKMKQDKMIIVFRHAGRLLKIKGEVLDRLSDFLYDNSNRLTLIITADPRLINFPSDAVNNLVGGNFVYYDRLDLQTAKHDIYVQGKIFKTDLSKYEDDIIKYSHNVHGNIAFLCMVLARYKPKKLNQAFIYERIYTHPKLRIFFDTCMESLTNEQIDIIHDYCIQHRIAKGHINSLDFRRLVEFNIFYKSGKSYKFIYDMFDGFIARFLTDRRLRTERQNTEPNFTNKYAQILYKINSSKVFSREELILLRLLVDKGGEIASYQEISKVLWNNTKYSMYAINKIISRIRAKLASQQDCKCLIVTKYKQGYYLAC